MFWWQEIITNFILQIGIMWLDNNLADSAGSEKFQNFYWGIVIINRFGKKKGGGGK